MFPVRYELDLYINLLRNSVFKGLINLFIISGISNIDKETLEVYLRCTCILDIIAARGGVQNFPKLIQDIR
jgi:hypothetical protein